MSALSLSSGEVRSAGTLFAALVLALIAVPVTIAPGAVAKTPGKTYCFNRVCHRVLTLAETRRAVGKRHMLIASYYSHCKVDKYNPCGLTSSGAKFRPGHADNAASPIYPNGTQLLVWNPVNKRAAVIRIDNAGPYWRNRTLDLSRAAAQKLGFRQRGMARLMVQVLRAPTRRQATFRRHRNYAPVPGYLGQFASIANALRSTANPATPTVTLAKVALPVKNVYLAERRIWLARMVETGPISVALMKRPNLRLPVRLVRAELSRMRKSTRVRHRKVAALTAKSQRSRRLKKKRLSRAKQQHRKAVKSKAEKGATGPKARKRTKQAKSIAKQTIKTPAKVAKAATDTAAKPSKPLAADATATQPVMNPRPKMVWRRAILGTNGGGA